MNDKYKKLFISLYFIMCSVFCLLVTLLPWWPSLDFVIIPKYIVLFGPRWWLLILILVLACFGRYFSKAQLRLYIVLILLSFNYLDFQLPTYSSFLSTNAEQGLELKIITFNMGGASSKELELLVKYMQPDILLLQEVANIQLNKLFNDSYFSKCTTNLCILSKYAFKQEKTLDRKLFGSWGKFAAFYQIFTPNGALSLANVHFETPRSVLESLVYLNFNQTLAVKTENNRELESSLLNLWAYNRKNTLIVGDFNMLSDENLYSDNFSFLNNAIETKGFAFNNTKNTSWYGARIDHILYSNEFVISSVEVIDLVEGDHRPLMATFTMKDTDL